MTVLATQEQSGSRLASRTGRMPWLDAYLRLFEFALQHGHCNVPQDYRGPDGFGLGKWVHNQRTAYRARRQARPPAGCHPLSDRRVALLEQVPGWQWHARRGRPRVRHWRELLVCSADAQTGRVLAEAIIRQRP